MLGDVQKYRSFFVISALVIFMSMAFDIFGAMTPAAFTQNFKDSEALVVNEVRCRGHYFAWQMAELKQPRPAGAPAVCNPGELKPYSSQFGLQGRAYTFGYVVLDKLLPGTLPVGLYVIAAEMATAALSAACLALVAVWARGRFGRGPAVFTVLAIALSPMLVGFGRNLYWALPLMLLPLLAALYWYGSYGGGALRRRLLFWTLIGALLYLRYLCGYEYLTSLTIMVAAVAGFHLWLARASLATYVQQFAVVLAVSVLAFGLALGTHVVALQGPAGGSRQALVIIKQRATERTTHSSEYLGYAVSGFKFNLPDQYMITNGYLNLDKKTDHPSQFWASLASLLNYTFTPVYTLPLLFVQPLATWLQSLLLFTVLLVWLYGRRRRWVAPARLRDIEGLFVGAFIGLTGFLSWLVLARAHSLVHAHINGILLYLPFALFGYVIIGMYLTHLLADWRKRLQA